MLNSSGEALLELDYHTGASTERTGEPTQVPGDLPRQGANCRSGSGRLSLSKQARVHQAFARSRLLRRLTVGVLARIELFIMNGHKRPEALNVIRQVRSERESLLSGNEAFMIYSLAAAQRAVGGVMAEVGVFQGCSAKLISIAGRPEELHLFDTFEGLPEPAHREHVAMRKGHYAASLPSVADYLKDQHNICFHRGLFTGEDVACADRRFSFVHLDVDLKEGTHRCLEFFYPRMLSGGIIISHDFSYLEGVREAFVEFLADRKESLVELPSSQVMLIKS